MRIDAAMERLLDDWGWWVRERGGSGYRCRSIEGRYRREGVNDGDQVPQAPRMVDEAACLRVERTVCHPGFPVLARTLLQGWFVRRDSMGHISARVGIPRAAFDDRLAWSAAILKNRLKINIDMRATLF